MGQVLPRAGLEGRDRVLPRLGPRHVPRRARLQHGRLRLHDLHRELRAAARADQRRGRRRRPRRLRRPLRQPELRGAHPRRGEGELPRVAAARRRLRARRADGRRPRERAARPGLRRRGRLPARPLAEPGRDRRRDRQVGQGRDVLLHLRRRLHRRRALARARDARGGAVRVGRGVDVRAPAAVLRRDAARARAGRRRRGRALPRLGRRLRHDRPHLAGGRDPARLAGGAVPDRARRRAARVQLLRRPPRQPRGDGARHVRERPPQEPPRARQRGDVDGPPARRRGGHDLRGRRALPQPRACRRS